MQSKESEFKEALAQLENYRDTIVRFFQQAPAAICILDGPDLRFEMLNPAYQNFFPERALLGRSVFEALPEIVGTPVEEMLRNVYLTGESFEGKEVELKVSRVNGSPLESIYFNFLYYPRFDAKNKVDGIHVLAYEVTDLVYSRQTKERLALMVAEQANAFDVALTAIKDFVYTFDLEGRFTFSNKPLLDLLGITLGDIVGKTFHDLPYPYELAAKLQSQISKVVSEGKPVSDETPYTNPEGKMGYYEYIFTPVFNTEGKVVLVAGSTRDISERKRSEESISKKNRQLLKINNDLDNFIYTASHDLKAPISNIEGLIAALKRYLSKESLEDPMVAKLLPMIQSSIDRFKHTLTDLTEIIKVQKLSEEELSEIYIPDLIKDIESDLYASISESGATILLVLNDCETIRFSKKNLRSIFFNLISNSLKYRSKDKAPVVSINCTSDSDFYTISIADNGLGMDLSGQTSIFGMFKRLHNHVEGTGVGLYIVRKIVENSGGSIEVESEVNVGSTFKVYLKK